MICYSIPTEHNVNSDINTVVNTVWRSAVGDPLWTTLDTLLADDYFSSAPMAKLIYVIRVLSITVPYQTFV